MADTPLNIEDLLSALDDEDNHSILQMSSCEMNELKYTTLSNIGLKDEILDRYMKSLKSYVYVDEIPDLKIGSLYRWISLKDPDSIYLSKGAYICDINICKEGVLIVIEESFQKVLSNFIELFTRIS